MIRTFFHIRRPEKTLPSALWQVSIRTDKAGVTIALLLLVLASSALIAGCGKENSIDPASLRGGETRETISPAYFTGKEAKAYAIAKEIPEILDSLYCYCDCKKHFGHKSLLTCYVDLHAKYCDVCMDEALMASDLHKQGYDAVSIRKAVDEKFGNGHSH